VADRYQPPSIEHWLGTDVLGRDLYSRVVHGAQVSLGIALASGALSLLLGVGIGAVAGWAGGWLDGLLMRFTDLVLAFPRIFLVLLLVAFVTPGPIWIVLVLGATGWMGVARLVRGSVLQLRGGEYVLAARSLGLPGSRILLRHVLPGAIAPVIAASTLRAGNTVLAESFLSFLGLGITDPSVSWGMLIRSGRDTMLDAWWVSTFPGLAIVLTVVGWNLLGDGLRDAYDRRLTPLAPRED
jgi:peptide/nickel transport system permease protein